MCCTLGSKLAVLMGLVVETFKGRTYLEEVAHWGMQVTCSKSLPLPVFPI